MKVIILIFTLFVTGCASKAPDLTQYLLRSDRAGPVKNKEPVSIGIGDLTVSPYIDVLGLVVETSDGIVHTARYHQWAEPLHESLPGFLAREIFAINKRAIGTHSYRESRWSQRIDIHINQLHGSADGNAKLEAKWSVLDLKKHTIVSQNWFSDTEPLNSDGYDTLFNAEKILLRRLANSIAETLN